MDEATIKHLELVQAVIGRFAQHSFVIKGWSVTVAAALFALSVNKADEHFAMVAFLPAVAFWGLDAYYLRRERLFRCLYDAILPEAQTGNALPLFSMDVSRFEDRVPSWIRTLPSITLLAFHGVIVLSALLILILTTCGAGHG